MIYPEGIEALDGPAFRQRVTYSSADLLALSLHPLAMRCPVPTSTPLWGSTGSSSDGTRGLYCLLRWSVGPDLCRCPGALRGRTTNAATPVRPTIGQSGRKF